MKTDDTPSRAPAETPAAATQGGSNEAEDQDSAPSASVQAYYQCYFDIDLYTGIGNSDTSPTPAYVVGSYAVRLQNGSYSKDSIILFNEGPAALKSFPKGFFLVSNAEVFFAPFDLSAPDWTYVDLAYPKSGSQVRPDFRLAIKARAYGTSRWGLQNEETNPAWTFANGYKFPVGAKFRKIELSRVGYGDASPRLEEDIISRLLTARDDYSWRTPRFSSSVWSAAKYVENLEKCRSIKSTEIGAILDREVAWFKKL